jgi:hypothetical protein
LSSSMEYVRMSLPVLESVRAISPFSRDEAHGQCWSEGSEKWRGRP